MKRSILVLNGPNLDRLGSREPTVYGSDSLAEILQRLTQLASDLGVELETYQSNYEGALVERLHQAADAGVAGVVVNAGGYTHSSVALRDAFLAVRLPFVEVHLSNLASRESFRQVSLLSDIAIGVVSGFGPESYELGLRGLVVRLPPG